MSSVRFLTAAAAIGGLAAPLAAQSPYPYPQPYPQTYPQQGYANDNVDGQIVDQLLGNRYNVTDRQAVRQCASAAVQQAAVQYPPSGYGGYNQGYAGQGYNQTYNLGATMRVTAITDVQRRNRGLRVSGLLESRGNGGHSHGDQGGYGTGYGSGTFPVYEGNGYYGTSAIRFQCDVDYAGAVTNVRIRPTRMKRR